MKDWFGNRPAALLIGLVLGVALQETLRTAIDAFVLLGQLGPRLVAGPERIGPTVLLILMLTALLGGAVAGLVTALLSGGRRTAIAAGVLLAVPAVALAAIALEGSALAALHAVPPVCGSALGARLALGEEGWATATRARRRARPTRSE
ncbi:hypothetical protein [Halomonas denitrificans]|nr:hypothetical protein [Halomonas denitrificans]